jgi:uncharacterized membrane protein
MNIVEKSATVDFVDAIRHELADLPDEELAEIVDDLTDHLEQVSAELGGDPTEADLEARLGRAEDYAAELRAAAGLGVSQKAGHSRRLLRGVVNGVLAVAVTFVVLGMVAHAVIGYSWLSASAAYAVMAAVVAIAIWLIARGGRDPMAQLAELPIIARGQQWANRAVDVLRGSAWGAATADFVSSLRPAWWLLRAWVATLLVYHLVAGFGGARPRWDSHTLFRVDLLWVVTFAVAVIASVWLGRRALSGLFTGWLRLGLMVVNTAVAIVTPFAVVAAGSAGGHLEQPSPALLDCPPGAIVVDATCVGTEVPRLDGLTVSDARNQLDILGFDMRVVPEDAGDDWIITHQHPASAAILVPGREVSLVAEACPDGSDGIYPDCIPVAEVADVIGEPVAQALDVLHALGFDVEVRGHTGGADEADGLVVDQEPRPGERIEVGGMITLTVDADG